jgi:hypothetical protein
LYGVVSDFLDQAVDLYPTRQEAEAVVDAWDEDEPGQAGALHTESFELEMVAQNQLGTATLGEEGAL